MKSIVVYFSQTGNTEKVARSIQSGIQSVTGQCDIVRLKEAKVDDLAKYDLIGFGAPAFGLLEPGNVAVFLKGTSPLSGKNCFIFATHGGHPGNIFPSMAEKLERAGLKVIGSFNCDGAYCVPSRFSPWYTDNHPDEVDLKQASDFGIEIATNNKRLSKGEKIPLPKFTWLTEGLYEVVGSAEHRRARRQVQLTLDKNKCIYPKCRLCVDNCPVDAIDLSTEPAIFQGRGCINCNFCEHICPSAAINYPEGFIPSLHQWFSDALHKYDYPKWYKKAEKELIENRGTLYRRLGGEVDIDDPEKAAYKVHPERPRIKLPRR